MGLRRQFTNVASDLHGAWSMFKSSKMAEKIDLWEYKIMTKYQP